MSVRLFLLDDHEVVREGLRSLLDSDPEMEVVGEASTSAEALARIPLLLPDVAILDVRLEDGNGIEVCREIRSTLPNVACLILTSYADDEALYASVLAGASGYLLKQINRRDLLADIKTVAGGGSLLEASVVDHVVEGIRNAPNEDERLAGLSPQERRILDLIADGLTNREIAVKMYLAEKTVKNYVSNLLAKLKVGTRTAAAVYATRRTTSAGSTGSYIAGKVNGPPDRERS
jgi:DNA-binding NarL/FixJ family response regulator